MEAPDELVSAAAGQAVEVEFLYLDLTTCSRCRGSDASLRAALEIVRPALESVAASVEVRKTLVETEEQARALRFVSSPTISVNGRDIAGEPIESSCAECGELCACEGGVDCRIWDYRGERHTEAPIGMVVEAILTEIGPTGAARSGVLGRSGAGEEALEVLWHVGERRLLASCCSVDEQATCCDPAEKAGCCGDPTSWSCGCR